MQTATAMKVSGEMASLMEWVRSSGLTDQSTRAIGSTGKLMDKERNSCRKKRELRLPVNGNTMSWSKESAHIAEEHTTRVSGKKANHGGKVEKFGPTRKGTRVSSSTANLSGWGGKLTKTTIPSMDTGFPANSLRANPGKVSSCSRWKF